MDDGASDSHSLGLGERRCRLRSVWHHSAIGIVLVLPTVNVQTFHFKDKAWPRRAAMGSVPGPMSSWFGTYFICGHGVYLLLIIVKVRLGIVTTKKSAKVTSACKVKRNNRRHQEHH